MTTPPIVAHCRHVAEFTKLENTALAATIFGMAHGVMGVEWDFWGFKSHAEHFSSTLAHDESERSEHEKIVLAEYQADAERLMATVVDALASAGKPMVAEQMLAMVARMNGNLDRQVERVLLKVLG